MANNFKLTHAAANAAADAVCALLNNGYLRIYSGTQPVSANVPLSGNTLLAELRYNATAFGAAVNGVATANSISDDVSADNSGTATFFRSFESDGSSVVFDGSVGTSGCDLNLNSVTIVAGAQVGVSAHTYTQPEA